MLALMMRLKEAGALVFLITSERGALHIKFEQVAESITLVPLPYPRKPLSWLGLPFLLFRLLKLRSALTDPLECIANDFYETYASLLVAKVLGARRVIGFWQSSYSFDSSNDLAKWEKYGANYLETRIASEPVAQHMNRLLRNVGLVTPLNPFLDDTRFNPVCYDRNKIRHNLGWCDAHIGIIVARVGPSKGQIRFATLLLEFAAQDSLGLNLRLGIVGPADPQDRLALSNLQEASSGKINYLGPRDDIPELLAASDVALFPGTIPESFGLSLMEALLMELPVLALKNVGAVNTLLKNQPEGLCSSLEEMCQKWRMLATASFKNSSLLNRRSIADEYGTLAYEAKLKEIFRV